MSRNPSRSRTLTAREHRTCSGKATASADTYAAASAASGAAPAGQEQISLSRLPRQRGAHGDPQGEQDDGVAERQAGPLFSLRTCASAFCADRASSRPRVLWLLVHKLWSSSVLEAALRAEDQHAHTQIFGQHCGGLYLDDGDRLTVRLDVFLSSRQP